MKDEEKKIAGRFDIFGEEINDLFPAEDFEKTFERFECLENKIKGLFPEDREERKIFGYE